jgi:tetratricopeptide (TPR) repeat protein
MKNQFTIILSLLTYVSVFSKSSDHVQYKEIDSLIVESQFASAWKALNKIHHDSTDRAVIKKTEFCLKYFSHTSYHLKFHFADLVKGETLLKRRQSEFSTSEVFANFNPEKELLKALRKNEGNAALHFAIGTYYYDVVLSYHDQWKKGTKETMALYYYHFTEAYKQNKKSALSCYAISYFYQSRRTNAKAKKYLLEALKIDTNYAAAHYNLAYSYSAQDSTDLAVAHAHKAYENYEIKSYKADAAFMCGILYSDIEKHEDAINWLLISDALAPGNVVLYETLLVSYLALKKEDETALITKNLYKYDWRTGRVFNSILDAYLKEEKTNTLQLFLENEIKLDPADKEYQGFTYMHLTQMHINLNQGLQAKENLDKARAAFNICYDKDHAIYRVLEKLEWTIKQP